MLRIICSGVFITFLIFIPGKSFPRDISLDMVETAFLEEHHAFRVYADQNWPPYGFVEYGEIKGFCNDYIRLLSRKAGFDVQFVEGYSWDSSLNLFKNGNIDIVPYMVSSSELSEFALFSDDTVYTNEIVLLAKKGSQLFRSFDSLSGKTLAIVKGYYYENLLRESYPDINLLLATDSKRLMHLVLEGKADAALEDRNVVNYFIRKDFFTGLTLESLPENSIFLSRPLRIAVRKDLPLLKSIIDKAMDVVSEEEFRSLEQQWFPSEGDGDSTVRDRIVLNEEEQEYLKHKGKLIFSPDPGWMPLEGSIDNRFAGIASGFRDYFQEQLGIEMEMLPAESWDQSVENLIQRKSDLTFVAMKNPVWDEFLDFTRPYLTFKLGIVTRPDVPYISDLANLEGRTVGIKKGGAEKLYANYPQLLFVDVDSLKDGLDAVASGDLFSYVDTLEAISYFTQRHSYSLKVNGQLDEMYEFSIATRNDEPLLGVIFEKLIDTIDIKTREEIINTWVYSLNEPGINYRLIRNILIIVLIVLIILAVSEVLLIRFNRKLDILSKYDSLTKLHNRRSLDNHLEQEFLESRRYGHPLSLILCDIDHFKRVNDTFGHGTGDKVLIQVALVLQSGIRDSDICGRWGGEEFLIICSHTDSMGAGNLAEILRKTIEETDFSLDRQITLSFGVLQLRPDMSVNHALELVDAALYASKEGGRNRVSTAGTPPH